jgi:hypothetical protein
MANSYYMNLDFLMVNAILYLQQYFAQIHALQTLQITFQLASQYAHINTGSFDNYTINRSLRYSSNTAEAVFPTAITLVVKHLELSTLPTVGAESEEPCPWMAISSGLESFLATLKPGESLSKTRQCDNATFLHVAASQAREDIVTYLIHRGVDVNVQDVCDRTPLFWAAREGQTYTARLLLRFKANV